MASGRNIPNKKSSDDDSALIKSDIEDLAAESKGDALQIIETAKKLDPKFLEGVSPSKRDTLVRGLALSLSIQKTHSGPLPDPETLSGYKDIIQDGAERIMVMAEKEQKARLDDRSTFARRMMNQSGVGQILGFVICMTAICGGIYLSSVGKETSGISAIIAALVALAGAFLYSKSKEK